MKTAVITWALPLPNPYGASLESVGVFLSADGGSNFSFIKDVPVTDDQRQTIADLAFGEWIVKLVVRDAQGRTSPDVDTSFIVPNESPPGDVFNVDVALT